MSDDILIVSTTDSDQDVQAAMGNTKDDRVAGEAPVADETPAGAGHQDEADAEPEDRQGVYVVPPPVPAPQLDDEDEDGAPKFKNYEEYLAEHSEWTMQEGARRLEERQVANRVHEAIHTTHIKAVASFKRTHSDFDATLKGAKPAIAKLVKELGPNVLGIIDQYTTSDADNGPAIIYHLAQHPEELKRIVRLPPALQLAALGKLDVVVDGSGSRRRSATPASRSSANSDPNVIDGEDYSTYKARRNKEEEDRERARWR